MKSFKSLSKIAFVSLSAMVLALGLAGAPQAALADSGDRHGEDRREDRRGGRDHFEDDGLGEVHGGMDDMFRQ